MTQTSGATRHGPRLAVLAALTVLAVLSSACGKKTESGTGTTVPKEANGTNITVADPGPPKTGGTLRFGLNAETDGWSPIKNQWAGSAYIVAGAIFDHLTEYDSNQVAKPYLAESLTPNADFTQWTIKMRPGVTFQNGEKCDGAALKKNFEAQRSSILTGPVFATVKSIDQVDDLSVKLTMDQPWSTLPDQLTTQPGAIAAPAMIDAPDGGVRQPIGTGPFSFENWTPNGKLVVKKNPNYWRQGFPLLDGIEFQVLPDLSSRSAALQTGAVDAIEIGEAGQIQRLSDQARSGKLQMFTDQGLQQQETFIGLNTAQAPFDDPLARQIVAYGTDRDALAKSVYQGMFPPALGPYGEQEPFYAKTDMPTYDPVKAKQLADEYKAKHGTPLTFSLLVTPQPEVMAAGAAGQASLKDIGVDMEVKPEEQAQLITDVILGHYTATGFILFGGVNIDTQSVFISGDTVRPIGQLSLNFTRNKDDVLTKALADARRTSDPAQQKAQYKIVQDQMAKDLNMIFLVHNVAAIAYGNSTHALNGYTLPDGSTGLTQVTPLTFAAWKS